ncbi:eIF-2-alpha kinase GCN2 [Battus philenor]|uniref:eIF-2-alpha kinase GCN2 n=1 Tax=Battus philenor TaxID=42288 RepID=UPI0035D0A794
MCDETPEERQRNELVALQSIFEKALEEVKGDADAWGEEEEEEAVARLGWRPLHVALALLPLHDAAGAHCALTLRFKCCHEYPDRPPKISVQSVSGLSLENLNTLLKELEQLSSQLRGEVMIYQLATHTQQFLHKHNKPSLSFFDQMVKDKTEIEEMRQRDQLVKENEEARRVRAELLKRQETLREAPRPDDDDALRLLCYEESRCATWGGAVEVGGGVGSGPCTCTGRGVRSLRFLSANTKIYVGNCLGHSRLGSAHVALDERGAAALVRRWALPGATHVRRREQQLAALQRDVAALAALRCAALAPYHALQLHTDTRTVACVAAPAARQHLYVARALLPGTSLRRQLAAARRWLGDADTLPLMRHVARAMFSALATLHEAGLLHRDVRLENVFLEQSGAVRLLGASVDARVFELLRADDSCDRHSRAQDVARAGDVLLSLVAAADQPLVPPAHLPPEARDLLARCVSQDEQSVWPAARLAAHPFLQPGVQCALSAPLPAREEEEHSRRTGDLDLLNNSTSRLSAEFEVLSWIGKGAFGDVVKVRNKLDCGLYAIKRIRLNPKDVALNRKITREVKLLSRLNHENVVRYYNAWIEASAGAGRAARGAGDTPVSIEWSMSSAARAHFAGCGSDDDDDDDDDDADDDDDDADPDPWTLSPEEDSSGVVFQDDDEKSIRSGLDGEAAAPTLASAQATESAGSAESSGSAGVVRSQHVLYIQMEFCEKHTLRQAIDQGLHEDPVRVWRLFREILEGLAHVHGQGMIHRDLKPANIFLDSNDHVKIGDFGLATNIFSRPALEGRPRAHDDGDSALTGEVGTALYVAPELRAGGATTRYNQKADLYSLGVTLFEMFHGPFATGAERVSVLTRLRRPDVQLPDYFDTAENAKQVYLLRWMLRANAAERPTCAQLAASQHVPRAVPQGALAALLAHALSDRDAPAYARLVRTCLEQRAPPADELLFHEEPRVAPPAAARVSRLADALVNVFRSHGAEELTPPLLTLAGDAWESRADAVRVMTSSGGVCLLPYDLRLPFARLVAQSGVQRLRRYAVGRVFRERAARGAHPRESLHCAFDVVAPRSEGLWADAEVLACAARCAARAGLSAARLRLGHAALLRALLCCVGLTAERAPPLVDALRDFALGRLARLQLQTHVATLALGARRAAALMRLVDADVPMHELPELVAQVQQDKWSEELQRGVRDLREVERRARALGCELAITVAPLLAYGAEQHCGVFWQLVACAPARRLRERHIVAAGGRYDELVERVGRAARAAGRGGAAPGAVGFSLSLERAAALAPDVPAEGACTLPVLVSVSGAGSAGGAALAREAWARGLSCSVWAGGGAEAARGALPAGLLLQPLGDTVRVDLWEESRVREMVLAPAEALDLLRQRQQPRAPDGGGRAACGDGERSAPAVLVTFVTGNEKLNKNYRRQIENQVAASVVARVTQAAGARRVLALALAADAATVAALAARLPAEPRAAAPLLPSALAELFRRADPLPDLARLAGPAGARDDAQLLALYSIPDGACRVLL